MVTLHTVSGENSGLHHNAQCGELICINTCTNVMFSSLVHEYRVEQNILILQNTLSSGVCFQVELSVILSQTEGTLSSLVQRGQELVGRLRALQVDRREIACLKFLLLFNPSESSPQSELHHHHGCSVPIYCVTH